MHSKITDVVLKPLVTHTDERGYFRELVRSTDDFFKEGFGQWSVSRMHPGTIKAWHIHKVQTDWWYVGRGSLKVALHDTRKDSATYRETMEIMMGELYEPLVVRIPPGVAHGCKALSGPADLFYITSQIYNPSDEGRIPHDDPTINYDWRKGPDIT